MSLWIRYQYEQKHFYTFFYSFNKQHNPIEKHVSQASETNDKIKTRKKNIIFQLTRLPNDDNVCFQLCRVKLNTSDCPSDYICINIYIYTFQSRWFKLSSYAIQNTKHMRVHHTILYNSIAPWQSYYTGNNTTDWSSSFFPNGCTTVPN